jgi:PIN domain nuclease of toxin-antitoxin system
MVVYWEIMLKSMKGLLDIGEPSLWWRDALDQLSARPLLLRPEHVSELHALPPIHRDPFDRMLLAQAAAEGLTLVSSDRDLARYKSSRIRILS